ncbi:cyclase [Streptomyces eurocidicus]|uniref:Cyclase n=1 Tax=Streptomyces eurocidicus TaxID=66423 RepID=A0A2N8NUZ8_STREU|nr:SRPBCC family protein [Streptomyces eurocidicus]MBB5122432.1 ribosome-associated toxin RatA of RatAB toxin-antitoxin module [Streptomyces eurocidicus]MBF6052161.1 cyclase [Streptomyces eurocidicus]PNE32606.1 cyclase [Streptomyces eurocidicus]
MPTVTLRVLAPALAPTETYARISDFARYPAMTATVESVVVRPPSPDGSVLSEWTVHFRNGLMKWKERDTFSPEALSISFEQVSGDFATFRGTWGVSADGAGTLVCFDAEFDLGIPTLAAILDPVAEAALRDNILKILDGLLGEAQEIVADPEPAATAQP